MVLSWLLKNSGQLGDMLDSDSERGLYASGVDRIALGMSIAAGAASWCASSAEHDACLRHLSLCLGAAINLVSLAIQVANGCQHVETDDAQVCQMSSISATKRSDITPEMRPTHASTARSCRNARTSRP